MLTFAVSDALNTVVIGTGVREEDGWIHNEVIFFTEPHKRLREYTAELRIDRRRVPYFTALDDVSRWWATLPDYTPAAAPEGSKTPMYSTWYNFHQSVESGVLLERARAGEADGLRGDHRRRRLADARHEARLRLHRRLGARAHARHEAFVDGATRSA